MSANVIKLRTEKAESVQKTGFLSNIFSNLLNQYRQKQDEIRQKKIKFLFNEAYNYFYDLLECPRAIGIDLPGFIYEEQRKKLAYEKASKALFEVITDDRLNKCYSRRVKELRNMRNRTGLTERNAPCGAERYFRAASDFKKHKDMSR